MISKKLLRRTFSLKGRNERKKLIDAPYESNIKSVVEKHVSPENLPISAGR